MSVARIVALFGREGFFGDLIRTSSVALALRVFGMLVTYVFNFIVARRYGASAVGGLALATTVVMVLGMLSRLGFDRAIVRFVAASIASGKAEMAGRQYRAALYIVGVLGCLLSLGMFFGADSLAVTVFKKPALENTFRIASPAVLFFSLNLFNAEAIRGLKKIWQFSLLRHVMTYLVAVVVLLLLHGSLTEDSVAVAAFSIACAVAAVISLVVARTSFGAGFSCNGVALGALLAVSLPMFFSNSMGMIISWSDVLMLGRFVSESEVGIYSICLKLAFGVSIVLNAVNSFSTPRFAELHAGGHTVEMASAMQQTTKLLFFTTFPLLIGIVALGKPLLGLFGLEFQAGYQALLILVLGQFFSALSGPIANLMQMSGLERAFLVIVGVLAVLNIGLNLLLIPRYGILGAAVSSAIALTLNNLACVLVVKWRHGFWSIYVPFLTKRKGRQVEQSKSVAGTNQ